jgi:hypothetical protein
VPYQPVTIVLGPAGTEELRVDGPIHADDLRAALEALTS